MKTKSFTIGILTISTLTSLSYATYAKIAPTPVVTAKKIYMDCETSSVATKRVVLKAQKSKDELTGFEVILVDEKGKSQVYMSKDILDSRFLDPDEIQNKHISIIGASKATTRVDGAIENAATVSLFSSDRLGEDMSCFKAGLKAGQALIDSEAVIKNKQILNEIKYKKFTGTLYHNNKVMQLNCFSPMLSREDSCNLPIDAKASKEEVPSSL